MSQTGTRLADAVARVFETVQNKLAVGTKVSAGAFVAEISFASRALADAYLRSFLPAGTAQSDLFIAVATADDADLSELIPEFLEKARAYFDDRHLAVWYADHLPVLHVFDRRERRGIVWLAKNVAPSWELSRPACPIIQAAALDGPWTAVHSAAVGRAGRTLLLAGKGRAGKTTAALACAREGWDYAGDDYVFVNTETARVEPLYRSARLRADMSGAFDDLISRVGHAVSRDEGETRHELNLAGGPAQIKGGQLAAILLPRRQGAVAPLFAPARRADAFGALFMMTSLGAPLPLKTTATKLTALTKLAPVFFVDTGQVPEAIPGAFAEFMSRL